MSLSEEISERAPLRFTLFFYLFEIVLCSFIIYYVIIKFIP
jgi:hypothetical protein